MSKTICVILVCLILVFSATPATADSEVQDVELQEMFSPQFTHILFLIPGLDITSAGESTCLGIVALYDSTHTVELTVELQKLNSGSWATIETWSGWGTGMTGVEVEHSHYVVRGTYRVRATAKVYNSQGKLVETATDNSPVGGADILLDFFILLNQYFVYMLLGSSLQETS